MSEAHHEKPFENYVVDKLVAQGWLLGETSGYDKDHALYPRGPSRMAQGDAAGEVGQARRAERR